MKIQEILQILTKEETKTFQAYLAQHKRKTLLALCVYLVKTQEPTKEEMYTSFSKNTYTASKDYLLRNELRLLTTEIEDYLTQLRLQEKQQEDPFISQLALLEVYKKRQAKDLFEKEWRILMKQYEQQQGYKEIDQLVDMWVDYVAYQKELHLGSMQETFDLLQHFYPITEYVCLEKLLNKKIKLAFFTRNIQILSNTLPVALKQSLHWDEEQIIQGSKVMEYYTLIPKMYDLGIDSDNRIAIFKKILEIIPTIKTHRKDIIRQEAIIINNLGIEYFIKSDFETASYYYQKAFQYYQEHNIQMIPTGFIMNYASASIALGNYQKTIYLYTAHKDQIIHDALYCFRFERMVCIAYLFLDEPQKAQEAISHTIFERPEQEYYFYRCVYVLLYLYKKEYDNAEREVMNVYKSLNYKAQTSPVYEVFIGFAKRYIRTLTLEKDQVRIKKTTELLHDITAHTQNTKEHNSSLFSLLKHIISK